MSKQYLSSCCGTEAESYTHTGPLIIETTYTCLKCNKSCRVSWFTTNEPLEDGKWYWWRPGGEKSREQIIRTENGVFYRIGDELEISYNEIQGHWQGPIKPEA